MRWLLFAFALVTVSAFSQEHIEDKKQSPRREQTGTEKKPFVVKIQPSHKTQAESKQDENDREAKAKSESLKQKTDEDLVRFTEKLADYTWLLFCVGLGQIAIFIAQLVFIFRQETATKTIERAYVQMSHVSNEDNPGLAINISGECRVSIGIKNYGATPARVTRVFLTKRVLTTQLPIIPEYRADSGEPLEQPTEAFLMKDAEIIVGFSFTIDSADIPLIRERKKQLVIYGFVDYTDQFGRDFRGGYARNYVPDLRPNNLIFTPQPRYNYDCNRQNDRCKDWPS
jgi:hypothetical protein